MKGIAFLVAAGTTASAAVVAAFTVTPQLHRSVLSSPRRFPFSSPSSSSTTIPEGHLFGDEFSEQLAKDVAAAVKFPFVPSPVVKYTLKEIITKLSADGVSRDSMERLQEILQTEGTKSNLDDVPEVEVNALADQIAKELNPLIDIPLLDEDQELPVLKQIMRVFFSSLTTNDKERRKGIIKASVDGSKSLLGSPDSRKQLVVAINAALDVPILDENQEASIIMLAVEASYEVLNKLLPKDMIETLKGESPQAIAKMKELVIQNLNNKVDVIGLDEEQERKVIETMVNIVIDQCVDDTEAEFLLLTAEEQILLLNEKKANLERKKILSLRRYKREQETLAVQLRRIRQRLKTARRSRSFFRRLFRRM